MPRINRTPDLATGVLSTPIGDLPLVAGDAGLKAVIFPGEQIVLEKQKGTPSAANHLDAAISALEEWFAGKRRDFPDLFLDADGTAFQHRVWSALSRIPFGHTCSYRDIAISIGNPKAMRAVGLANGRNPLPIIVPCHRVVGAKGALTGFRGGLETKKWLLEFEGVLSPSTPVFL